jgi:hypothetical protein
LARERRPRIGVSWSGRRTHRNDRNRSLRLEALAPLAQSGAALHFLQPELRQEDVVALARLGTIAHYGPALHDFTETASLIMQLDLVITVDTSVAHLAGALGKPVWILIPFAPDFRWMRDRSDSPWYPTARLFRQPAPGNWDGALQAMFGALGDWLRDFGAGGPAVG